MGLRGHGGHSGTGDSRGGSTEGWGGSELGDVKGWGAPMDVAPRGGGHQGTADPADDVSRPGPAPHRTAATRSRPAAPGRSRSRPLPHSHPPALPHEPPFPSGTFSARAPPPPRSVRAEVGGDAVPRGTGSGARRPEAAGSMAGLSVRDPAVDRSLRSVFGEGRAAGGGSGPGCPSCGSAASRPPRRGLSAAVSLPQWGTSRTRPRRSS